MRVEDVGNTADIKFKISVFEELKPLGQFSL